MPPWLRYVVGMVIAIHGYVYVPFAFYLVNEFQRSHGGPKLLGSLLATREVRTATLASHVTAGLCLLACGLMVAFTPGAVVVWRALAITGGALGVLAFLAAWNGRLSHLSEQGILGATASLAVVVASAAFAPALA